MQSVLWRSPVPPAAKHPHILQLVWGSQACKFPPFFIKVTTVIVAKQFSFNFIRLQDMSPNVFLSSSLCAFTNCNLAFLCCFGNNGYFLAEWPFSPCCFRTRFTVDNDTLLPASASIFTRTFAFVLGLIHTSQQSTLISRTRLLPEWYGG